MSDFTTNTGKPYPLTVRDLAIGLSPFPDDIFFINQKLGRMLWAQIARNVRGQARSVLITKPTHGDHQFYMSIDRAALKTIIPIPIQQDMIPPGKTGRFFGLIIGPQVRCDLLNNLLHNSLPAILKSRSRPAWSARKRPISRPSLYV